MKFAAESSRVKIKILRTAEKADFLSHFVAVVDVLSTNNISCLVLARLARLQEPRLSISHLTYGGSTIIIKNIKGHFHVKYSSCVLLEFVQSRECKKYAFAVIARDANKN